MLATPGAEPGHTSSWNLLKNWRGMKYLETLSCLSRNDETSQKREFPHRSPQETQNDETSQTREFPLLTLQKKETQFVSYSLVAK